MLESAVLIYHRIHKSTEILFVSFNLHSLLILMPAAIEPLPPVGHAIAGSAGAMFALAVVYPLDM